MNDFGEVDRLLLLTTRGHTDHVGNNDLVDQSAAPTIRCYHPHLRGTARVDGRAFLARLTEDLRANSADDAATNPVGTAMVAVNELEEAGLVRRPREPLWERPTLKNPAAVTVKPQGLTIIPAAAEMLRWKRRRKHG